MEWNGMEWNGMEWNGEQDIPLMFGNHPCNYFIVEYSDQNVAYVGL